MSVTNPSTTSLATALAQAEALAEQARANDADASVAAATILAQARELEAARWKPYPWQHPHTHPKDNRNVCGPACYQVGTEQVGVHGTWLQLGGRGTGKTEGAARYVNAHVTGPPCDARLQGGHRLVIVAPTQGDAADACVEGPSGLKTINPRVRMVTHRGGTFVYWPNGARARLLGASGPEDIDRLRAAGNTCLVWLEEVAAMRYLAQTLDHTALGLRIGERPHYVASTTPKPRPEIRALVAAPDTLVTRGRTEDATYLDPQLRAKYLTRWGGTRLGRQELGGEVLEDVEGALWTHEQIDADRVPAGTVVAPGFDAPSATLVTLRRCHRVVVAVDPPGGTTEAGIVVVGTIGDHGYVLADLSGKMTPDKWAKVAVDAYYTFGAECICIETAYGGDMVANTIRTVDNTVPLQRVPTKVGKRLRAEPVQSVYEQHRVHHVGLFPDLEDQQTTWVPDESPESPDRLDALVHGVTWLLVRAQAGTVGSATGRRIRPPARVTR